MDPTHILNTDISNHWTVPGRSVRSVHSSSFRSVLGFTKLQCFFFLFLWGGAFRGKSPKFLIFPPSNNKFCCFFKNFFTFSLPQKEFLPLLNYISRKKTLLTKPFTARDEYQFKPNTNMRTLYLTFWKSISMNPLWHVFYLLHCC